MGLYFSRKVQSATVYDLPTTVNNSRSSFYEKSNSTTYENSEDVIQDLEAQGFNKVKQIFSHSNGNMDLEKVQHTIIDVISSGADDFKQRTGRPMTYAEMRAAYG
jgi:hypothetical protein